MMVEYECRLASIASKKWHNIGQHPSRFAAAVDFLCQMAGWGGADLTLWEIECREVRTIQQTGKERGDGK